MLQIIKKNWYFLTVLTALVIGLYLPTVSYDFVSDDIPTIVNKANIGGYEWVGLGFGGQWVNDTIYNIFGANPIPFRSANIIFHLGTTWLIFIILIIITQKKHLTFLATLFFAVHPILIESITWISGRIYIQYTFFLLLSFYFYITSAEWQKNPYRILLTILFFFLALFSSEKSIIYPGILFVYELSFGSLKKYWLKMLPHFGISLLWSILYIGKIAKRISDLQVQYYSDPTTGSHPLMQIPISISYYLQLIFWPDKLSLYQTEMFFTPLEFWIRVMILILFIALLIFTFFKAKKYFFWLSLFVISLLPTILPLGIAWIVAERYVYLGTIGIIVASTTAWLALNEKIYKNKKIFWIVGLIFVLLLSIRTIVRNKDWTNQDTLWIATAQVAPSGYNIHNNLGDVYGRQGNKLRAIEEFQTAIAINPRYADAMHNLATVYIEIGKVNEAIYWYKEALKNGPHLWQSAQNLGLIYFQLGDLTTAETYIKAAIKINPSNENLQKNLEIIIDAENQTNAPTP